MAQNKIEKSTSVATLTSLAMLKVNIDSRGTDYVEYLVPFVLHILATSQPETVTDATVSSAVRQVFGLRIPTRGVHLVLQRLVKRRLLERCEGRYVVAKKIPTTDIDERRDLAAREIGEVVLKLQDFAQASFNLNWNESEATTAVLSFLSRFAVECLKTYTFGTALPIIEHKAQKELFVVGAFFKSAHTSDGQLFEKIIIVVKGHMLANALICPDLESIEKKFGQVTFYFDTPLILDILSLQSPAEAEAQLELLQLIKRLNGKISVFSHTMDELHAVLQAAETALESESGRSRVVDEMRRRGKTRSDLILVREKLPEFVRDLGFSILRTPEYTAKYQISERDLEEALHDEIAYFNERAVEHDVNSVRSIYVLRAGKTPVRLEDAVAVFVTSNSAFARAAFEYGRQHEASREVSPVITDFSLSNIAWLKAPLGAPQLPMKEMLASCYAVMSPKKELWTRFIEEVRRLREQGRISADDHQILRSAVQSRDELMALTLGEDELLKPATIGEILNRVRADLTRDKDAEIAVIRSEKDDAQNRVRRLSEHQQAVQQRVYWVADRIGRLVANLVIALVLVSLLAAVAASPLATSTFVRGSYLLTACVNGVAFFSSVFGVLTWATDLTIGGLHGRARNMVRSLSLRLINRLVLPAAPARAELHQISVTRQS